MLSSTKVVAILLESRMAFYYVWVYTCALHTFLHNCLIYHLRLNCGPSSILQALAQASFTDILAQIYV